MSIDVTDREHLFEMERGMVGTLSLDERLKVILQGIEVLGYDRIRLYFLSPDGKALVGKVQVGGIGAGSFEGLRLPLEEDPYSRNVLRKKEPAIYKPGDLGPIPLWIDKLLDKQGIPWIDLPLLVDGQLIGLISLDNKHSGRPFEESELKRLMPYANSAAQAIATAREHEAVRSRALELEKLREVDAEIAQTLEMREALSRIVQACLELTGAESGNIRLQKGDRLVQMASIGWFSAILGQELPMSQDHIPQVWVSKTGKRYIANRAQEDKHIIEWKSKMTDETGLRVLESLGSYVSYPLDVGGRTIGVLSLQSKEPDFFTDQICAIVEDFRPRAAIAIENARLFEETQRRIRDLETINQFGRKVSAKLDIQDLLQTIVQEIAQYLDCVHCVLFFRQGEQGELLLVPQVSHGVPFEWIRTRRFKLGEGLAGWALEKGKSLVVDDARYDPRFVPARKEQDQPWAMLVVPMKVGEQAIGVISASQDKLGWFDENDQRLVEALASQAAIAIENARLVTQLEERFGEIAHQFRSPLTDMRGFTQLLADGIETRPEKMQEYYTYILAAMEDFDSMVTDMLNLRRIEAGVFKFRMGKVSLRNVVRKAVDLYRYGAMVKQIEVGIAFGHQQDIIMADEDRLVAAVQVLVENAIDFSHRGDQVTISTEDEGDTVYVSVEDEGWGIPEKELPRVFEKYFRGEIAHRERIEGTGIGLAIAEYIVERHGGRISVDTVFGKGSTFTIHLPCSQEVDNGR